VQTLPDVLLMMDKKAHKSMGGEGDASACEAQAGRGGLAAGRFLSVLFGHAFLTTDTPFTGSNPAARSNNPDPALLEAIAVCLRNRKYRRQKPPALHIVPPECRNLRRRAKA
jgi:hypothetical protein